MLLPTVFSQHKRKEKISTYTSDSEISSNIKDMENLKFTINCVLRCTHTDGHILQDMTYCWPPTSSCGSDGPHGSILGTIQTVLAPYHGIQHRLMLDNHTVKNSNEG